MQSNTTQKNIGAFFRQSLMLLVLAICSTVPGWAQPYVNGNLITGTTSANGLVTAPTGFSLSEMQPGIVNYGFSANLEGATQFSLADDFTIPAGQTWNLTTLTVFGYVTGYAGTTSPFDEIRVQIFDTDPSIGTPTPIFGDLTTNRFAASVSASVYRILNDPNPPLNTDRHVWAITGNVATALTAGHYWIEFQVGQITAPSSFMPASTVVGTATQPGNNAYSHNVTTNTWSPLMDGTNPQDMPWVLDYTTSCGGTPPTVTVSPTTGLCGPVTLTASGATDYTWSPATGLNTTTGATVTAAPDVTTTYTITGVTAGCAGTTTVTVNASPSNAVLGGVPPSTVHLNEVFDAGVPATWTLVNNSDVIGAIPTWVTGTASLFPPHSGGPTSYIFSSFQSTAGTEISNWVITPEIPVISNGDVLSFYTRTVDLGTTVFPDRMEVRMSTAGASTNVGTLPNDVGDFTTLLVSINPSLNATDYPDEWTRFEATISGLATPVSGRFAFRHWVTDAGPTGTNSDNIGLDDVRFETPSTCIAPGSPQTIFVNITGGTGPYTLVYSDGVSNQTVNNYNSGDDITVSPTTSSTYTVVSVTDASGCAATAVSGSFTLAIGGPPTISTQPPATLDVCENGSESLVVVSPGNTYQWQVSTDGGATWTDVTDGANYSGATSDSLTLIDVPASWNNYQYQVIVSSPCATTATSTATVITVAPGAAITTHPADVTVCSGATASFNVVATGATAYQWEVSTDGGATWTVLTGETAATLDVTNVNITQNGYQYHVLVSGGCGTPTASGSAVLMVDESTVITTQPSSIAACVGNNANFSVIASGAANTYQWQESTDGGATWTDIAGANGATYTTPAVTAGMNNYQYQVVITNPCSAAVTSSAATLTITASASIDVQPTDVTVCEGTPAIFTVTTTGATSFQWQISTDAGATFTAISGETNATLTIPTPTASQSGTVYNVLVGSCGTPLTSANVTLTVNEAAAITAQPVSTSDCEGATATFSVTATGPGVTYQWQESTDGGVTWNDIPAANGDSYTTPTLTAAMNNYQYQVVLNNACTTNLTSDAATLTVSATATIVTQPASVTVCDGAAASFSVTATGATGYQWQVSTDAGATFTDISGETNATLNLAAVNTTDHDGNIYHVVITSCGPTPQTSDNVTLTVNEMEAIITEPTSVSACDGADATFTADASGTSTTYQWQVSTDGGTTWSDLTGETNVTLNLTAVDGSMDGNQYRVVINGNCATNVNSAAATLTVGSGATITAQPVNDEVCVGDDASFTVSSDDATTYQWEVSTDGGTTWNAVGGGTTATLSVADVDASFNNNQYRAIVSNDCGDVTSDAVTLTVVDQPVATITADVTTITPGQTATLTATPAGATYQWFLNGVPVAGATNETLEVNASQAGDYTVEVTNAAGCVGVSNMITIVSTTASYQFITANPNNGVFRVNFPGEGYTVAGRVVTIYDSKGRLVHKQAFTANLTNTVDAVDVSVPYLPGGVYHLMLSESNGKRLKTGQLIIQ